MLSISLDTFVWHTIWFNYIPKTHAKRIRFVSIFCKRLTLRMNFREFFKIQDTICVWIFFMFFICYFLFASLSLALTSSTICHSLPVGSHRASRRGMLDAFFVIFRPLYAYDEHLNTTRSPFAINKIVQIKHLYGKTHWGGTVGSSSSSSQW